MQQLKKCNDIGSVSDDDVGPRDGRLCQGLGIWRGNWEVGTLSEWSYWMQLGTWTRDLHFARSHEPIFASESDPSPGFEL
jgi:hypothetical protein